MNSETSNHHPLSLTSEKATAIKDIVQDCESGLTPRRSFLFVPLNKPHFLEKLPHTQADAFIFDLEDSVPQVEKSAARKRISDLSDVITKLKNNNQEVYLRINAYSTNEWPLDIEGDNVALFDGLMISKAESDSEIKAVQDRLPADKKDMKIMPLVETPKGLLNLKDIVSNTAEISYLGLGYGDLSLEFGIERGDIDQSPILNYALCQSLVIAKAFNVPLITAPYRGFSEKALENLASETIYEKSCGAMGKMVVHPAQVDIVNNIYSITTEELQRNIDILLTFANNLKTNAVSIDQRYYGFPSLKTARSIVATAIQEGRINL